MSITLEKAYSIANSLYERAVVGECFENNEEWIFYFSYKPLMPGDWISPAVINKSTGAVTQLVNRFKGYFLGMVKSRFDPLTNGYTQVDLPTAVGQTEPQAVLRAVSA